MNRFVRLARFEQIYDNSRKPSRTKFAEMFSEFGFTDVEFQAWADGREWAT